MQILDAVSPFREEPTNAVSQRSEPSALQFSFILDSRCTQPMVIQYAPTTQLRATKDLRHEIVRVMLEAQLADYVDQMAGTEFDLDRLLEAASIQHLLSPDDE